MARPTTATHPVYEIPRAPIAVRDTRASQLQLPDNDNRYQPGPLYTPLPPVAPPEHTYPWPQAAPPIARQAEPHQPSRTPTAMRPRGIKRARRSQLEVLGTQPAGIEQAYYALQRVRALEQRLARIIGNLEDSSLDELLKVRPDLARYRASEQG